MARLEIDFPLLLRIHENHLIILKVMCVSDDLTIDLRDSLKAASHLSQNFSDPKGISPVAFTCEQLGQACLAIKSFYNIKLSGN